MSHIFVPEHLEARLEVSAAELSNDTSVHQLVAQLLSDFSEHPKELVYEDLVFPLEPENYFLVRLDSDLLLRGSYTLPENKVNLSERLGLQPLIPFSQILERLPQVAPQSDPNGDRLEQRLTAVAKYLPIFRQLPQSIERTRAEIGVYRFLQPLIKLESRKGQPLTLKVYLCQDESHSAVHIGEVETGVEVGGHKETPATEAEIIQRLGELIYRTVLGQEQPPLSEVDASFLKLKFPALGRRLIGFFQQTLHDTSYTRPSEVVAEFEAGWQEWWEQRQLYKKAQQQLEHYAYYEEALATFEQIGLDYQVAWEVWPSIEKAEEALVKDKLTNPYNTDLRKFARLENRLQKLKDPQLANLIPDLARQQERLERLWYYAQAATLQQSNDPVKLREAQQNFTKLGGSYNDADIRKAAVDWKISYLNAIDFWNMVRKGKRNPAQADLRQAQSQFQHLQTELKNFKPEEPYLRVANLELELANYLGELSADELPKTKQSSLPRLDLKALSDFWGNLKRRYQGQLRVQRHIAVISLIIGLIVGFIVLVLVIVSGKLGQSRPTPTATGAVAPVVSPVLPAPSVTVAPTLPNTNPPPSLTPRPETPSVRATFTPAPSPTLPAPTAPTVPANLPVFHAFFPTEDGQNPKTDFTVGQPVLVTIIYETNGLKVAEFEGTLYLNDAPKFTNTYKLAEQPENGKLIIQLGQLNDEGNYRFEVRVPGGTESQSREFKVSPAPTATPRPTTVAPKPPPPVANNPPAPNPGGGGKPADPPSSNNPPPPTATTAPWTAGTVAKPTISITVTLPRPGG